MRSGKFRTTPKTVSPNTKAQLPTFLDHLHELRRRLFWVVTTILLAASISYSFLDQIFRILLAPLGNQRLVYLTPGGGLSFSFKLCAYAGLLAAVPVIMYHLYKFLEPIMGQKRRSAIFYVGLSSLLAIAGICFAYYVSLPGALHFLTGFNMEHIQAMLTGDSYLSFVLTYLLGAAILFQIPILMMIINTMTPLKPSKLMKLQRYVIVAAFIIGAVISPTPDMMNQTIFALPIIGMYQLGVILVWVQSKFKTRQPTQSHQIMEVPKISVPIIKTAPVAVAPRVAPKTVTAPSKVFSDIKTPSNLPNNLAKASPKLIRPKITQPRESAIRPAPRLNVPARSIDGFIKYRGASMAKTT